MLAWSFLDACYSCDACGKWFNKNRPLKWHMQKCHDNSSSQWMCKECSKGFCYSRGLNAHKNEVHLKEKKVFSKVFKTSNLHRHMLTHSEKQLYTCQQCGKQFARQYNLTRHMQTHDTDKPYKCTHRDKTFSRSDVLTAHQRTHMDQTSWKNRHLESDMQLFPGQGM